MFRKTTGTILCPSCGRLTRADAPACLICGRRNPGLWGFAGPLRTLSRSWNFTGGVTAACAALYVLSLAVDPAAAFHRPRGLFDALAPSGWALDLLGMTGAVAWRDGRWWTLLTAIYLHGGPLHILFNLLWIRQLAPAVEELYGPARLTMIFTAAGAAGFALSIALGVPFTIGASGGVFGLLGALVAFGRKRGGVFGRLVLRQHWQWALILFVLGFLMPGVNNWGHAGGFVGGFLAGLGLSLAERRAEQAWEQAGAVGAVGLTVLGFALAVWTGLAGG